MDVPPASWTCRMTDALAALRELGSRSVFEIAESRMHFRPVDYSREIERVQNLPMRPAAEFSETSRTYLRDAVTKPGSSMKLWDTQCAALLAALDAYTLVEGNRRAPGLFGAVAVGQGKTLIAGLLGTVWRRERGVVLTTASLLSQTEGLLQDYRACFYMPSEVSVLPYSTLSNADHEDVLEKLAPEFIVADEAHSLSNKTSARGRRFRRYLNEHPGTLVAMLTGTVTKKSLLEWAELSDLALGDWSPAPRDYPTRKAWAQALDLEPVRAVGALATLAGGPGANIDDVRYALSERISRGPGCVASREDAVDVPLIIRAFEEPRSVAIDHALNGLAATWTRPDGEELALAPEFAEVNRQLRLGGYYGWEYEPDREWLRVRREYRRAVREWIKHHPRQKLDSMLAVQRAILNGWMRLTEYDAWLAIKDRAHEPPKVWRWIDEVIAEWWSIRMTDAGVEAVGFGKRIAFAERVAELAGVPYYGAGRKAAKDLTTEKGDRSIVCSLGAHGQGKNLQAWPRACVFDAPSTGATWEQLLGRLHRPGQEAERVVYEVSLAWLEEVGRAQKEAHWISATTGAPQKMQQAAVEVVTERKT